MKLAHLLPVSIIDSTPPQQRVHLALAPLVFQYKEYERFLRKKLERGDTVIIDNPVHENETVIPEIWLNVVRSLRPTVAVVPDAIDDALLTIKQARAYVPLLTGLGVTPMVVPHGTEQRDFFSCARELATIPGVGYFGVSLERRLNDDELACQRRLERVRWMKRSERLDHIKLHLLGVSEYATEFLRWPKAEVEVWSRASSADTSKFAVFALSGSPQVPPAPVTTPYPGRKIFGSAMDYFYHIPTFKPYGKHHLTRNLQLWCDYAERSEH